MRGIDLLEWRTISGGLRKMGAWASKKSIHEKISKGIKYLMATGLVLLHSEALPNPGFPWPFETLKEGC